MTIKMYYENPEIAETRMTVNQSGKDEKGQYIVADQTIFYPEGGGQPADLGTIGDANVLDVQLVEGEIRHYTDTPLEVGGYPAKIDWNRRMDHMQQHAGQHVLSAVFADSFNVNTTSFHLGEERVSIDLAIPEISKDVLMAAEAAANRAIQGHLPITTEWVTAEQAKDMPLRKPSAVKEDIRLVKMGGIDLNACGGTHPENTAAIGLIKIISAEKAKSGTRVYFLCGDRALDHFNALVETTDDLVRQLNSPLKGLPSATAALFEEKAAIEKELKNVRQALLEVEAANIRPGKNAVSAERIFYNRSAKEVQQLAKLIATREKKAYVFLMSVESGGVRFVCAKGEEAPGDMRVVLKEMLALTDGKGGGNSEFVQGGGNTNYENEDFIHAFQASIKNIREIL